MSMVARNKAAFIDRDGVINYEKNYVHDIEDFEIISGVTQGLRLLQDAGYRLIVITNQAGIARGYYDTLTMEKLHDHMRKQFSREGVELDAIYFCPHHPEGQVKEFAIHCDCRKPSSGMVLRAEKDFELDLLASVLIGDKLSDIECGKHANVGLCILVKTGHPLNEESKRIADLVVADLFDAACYVVDSENRKRVPV